MTAAAKPPKVLYFVVDSAAETDATHWRRLACARDDAWAASRFWGRPFTIHRYTLTPTPGARRKKT